VFTPAIAHPLVGCIVAISILLMLIRPRNKPEVYWVGAGVALLLVFRLIPLRLAARAAAEGTDVYLFLIGMMLLSGLAREYGVFDWLSSAAVRRANGSPTRLFLLVYLAGTLVTILLSNDATAVVLTPAILFAVRKARIDPLPYLFACALIANAASFVLPISNPANLVVFHDRMPPLPLWLVWFAFPSLLSILATYLVLRWVFRSRFAGPVHSAIEVPVLTPHGKLVVAGLFVTVAVLLVASGLGWNLGLPTVLTALAISGMASVTAKRNPLPLLGEVSWSTLALVAALFVMVDAVESIGALRHTEAWLRAAALLGPAPGALSTGFVVGVANNVVNNLPLGLLAGNTLRAVHASGLLAAAVLIGVDLGPNLAVTGSLATILWLIALRRENLDVSFWDFLKVGVVAMPAALLLSLAGAVALQILFSFR